MGIKVKKEDFMKKEKVIVPEDLSETISLEDYDLDQLGDHMIMMPKFDEDLEREENLKKNIKDEWLQ